MKKTEIVVHDSATTDGPGNNTAAIRRWHMGTPPNGPADGPYRDIAYHALIELVGSDYEVIMGRHWDVDGAHTKGHNRKGFGLCLIGDFSKEPPPAAQLLKAVAFVQFLRRLLEIPLEEIYPHRDLNATLCPGEAFPWEEFICRIGG